jgi:hypothetical protein
MVGIVEGANEAQIRRPLALAELEAHESVRVLALALARQRDGERVPVPVPGAHERLPLPDPDQQGAILGLDGNAPQPERSTGSASFHRRP